MISRFRYISAALIGVLGFALMTAGCGEDPVEPKPLPRITSFQASPSDIVPGDSSRISYQATDADSIKLFPAGSKLSPVSSGSIWVSPAIPTAYRLMAYNSVGSASADLNITMSAVAPQITSLTLSIPRLLPGESTVLTWKAIQADSIVIDNAIGKLVNPDSGQLTLTPTATITYTAIAYGAGITDTAAITVVVEIAAGIEAPNGRFYKGVMGAGLVSPVLSFKVVDDIGNGLTRPWMHFSVIEGDGILSVDSAEGSATLNYQFSNTLGHGIVRGIVTDIDTVEVEVRANAIIPGAGGQGQYVLFSDNYAEVKLLNGEPADEAEDPNVYLTYADYEVALGVVAIIEDTNQSGAPEDYEPVWGMIFTANFSGARTVDSIGIGSTMDEVRSIYGTADTSYLDPDPPAAQTFIYRAEGLTFYTTVSSDSTVFELHVIEVSGSGSSKSKGAVQKSVLSSAAPSAYYLPTRWK